MADAFKNLSKLLSKSASKTLALYQNDAEPASKRTRNGDGNKQHGKGKGKQDKQDKQFQKPVAPSNNNHTLPLLTRAVLRVE